MITSIKERIYNILKSIDDEEETFMMIKKLVIADFLNRLDIVQLKFKLEKETETNIIADNKICLGSAKIFEMLLNGK
jgi:hypothetical protein